MESESSLVRSKGRVELEASVQTMGAQCQLSHQKPSGNEAERTDLDSVTSVDLGLSLVVLPDDSEGDDSLRDLIPNTRR